MDLGGGIVSSDRGSGGDPRTCLKALSSGANLDGREVEALFQRIMRGEVDTVTTAALLVALRTKGETAEEIEGAARVVRDHATRVSTSRRPLVDTCGTGGDHSGSFNISTTAAFVVAASGVAVAKHGNRSATSQSGSADVLEAAGAPIDLDAEAVGRVIDGVGIGFMFAPGFHAAMRHAAEARRALSIRTVFNLIGPLANPAQATRQVLGVPEARYVGVLGQVLQRLGSEHALVVHGSDGLDEVSVSSTTSVAEVRPDEIVMRQVEPEELGLERHELGSLEGGDPRRNAEILRAVLGGKGSDAQAAVVAANAGAAIYVGGAAETWPQGVQHARDLIASGAPLGLFDAFVEASLGAR